MTEMMNEDGGAVIDFIEFRKKRGVIEHDPHYQLQINQMNKFELLEEMVKYQDQMREFNELLESKPPGQKTLEDRSLEERKRLKMLIQGKILFRALEERAETDDLRLLSTSYRRHCEYEIKLLLKPFFST